MSTPQVSSAPASNSSFDAGLPASLIENLYLPGGKSSSWPSGPLVPPPATTLIVCLLIVTAASTSFELTKASLAWPGGAQARPQGRCDQRESGDEKSGRRGEGRHDAEAGPSGEV